MQLYKINQNGNKYCGPSVVSALAGIGTKEVAAIIRAKNGRAFIKSSTTGDVSNALRLLGFGVSVFGFYSKQTRMTLRQWAAKHARAKDVYLVAAGHHWILVQGRNAMCGKTIDLVNVAEHPNARAFVQEAHKITIRSKVDASTVIPKVEKIPSAGRQKAKRLAEEFGIEIEKNREYRDFMVYPPAAISEASDPHQGDHYCSDWPAVLEMVETYVNILQTRAAKREARKAVKTRELEAAQV